jgi:hypothetical protein
MTNSGRGESGGRYPGRSDTTWNTDWDPEWDAERRPGTEPGGEQAGTEPPPDIDALRREIAHTREELGATVEALAAKADIVARAKERAGRTKTNVRDQAQHRLSAVRRKVGDVGQEGRHRADRLATKAKDTAAAREVTPKGRSGKVMAALATAVIVAVWMRRRRIRMYERSRIPGTRLTLGKGAGRGTRPFGRRFTAGRSVTTRRGATRAMDMTTRRGLASRGRLATGKGFAVRGHRPGYRRRYVMWKSA